MTEMASLVSNRRRSSHQTQWAAQFAAASELCRRSYQVALTLGNQPSVDIMVMSPNGYQFKIDVKGLYRPNYFIIRRRELIEGLCYILVLVPDPPANPEFFILTHEQVIAAQIDDLAIGRLRNPDINDTYPVQGIRWKAAQNFKDKWCSLPP